MKYKENTTQFPNRSLLLTHRVSLVRRIINTYDTSDNVLNTAWTIDSPNLAVNYTANPHYKLTFD